MSIRISKNIDDNSIKYSNGLQSMEALIGSMVSSINEPVKHKILDLIGDFYLTGFNPMDLKAEVIVKEAGHAVHVKVAKILKDKIQKEV